MAAKCSKTGTCTQRAIPTWLFSKFQGQQLYWLHGDTLQCPSDLWPLCCRCMYKATELDEVVGDIIHKEGSGTQSPSGSTDSMEILSKVNTPNNQVCALTFKQTFCNVLSYTCVYFTIILWCHFLQNLNAVESAYKELIGTIKISFFITRFPYKRIVN